MRLMPDGPAFARAREGCLASWKAGGATIDFAARVPELAPRCGLVLAHFRPRARIGRVGSLEWRWIGSFCQSYLPRVAERGLLAPEELEAWRREWREREAGDASWVLTPTMADVVLRKG